MTRTPRRRAAAAVELALILPLMAVFTAMVVDFARVLHTTQVLTTAAQNAVAMSAGTAADPSSADPTTTAAVRAGAVLDPPLLANQVTANTAGGVTTVTVVYNQPLLLAVFYPGGTVSLQRTACQKTVPKCGD